VAEYEGVQRADQMDISPTIARVKLVQNHDKVPAWHSFRAAEAYALQNTSTEGSALAVSGLVSCFWPCQVKLGKNEGESGDYCC
jgi:hypothetical protein